MLLSMVMSESCLVIFAIATMFVFCSFCLPRYIWHLVVIAFANILVTKFTTVFCCFSFEIDFFLCIESKVTNNLLTVVSSSVIFVCISVVVVSVSVLLLLLFAHKTLISSIILVMAIDASFAALKDFIFN